MSIAQNSCASTKVTWHSWLEMVSIDGILKVTLVERLVMSRTCNAMLTYIFMFAQVGPQNYGALVS